MAALILEIIGRHGSRFVPVDRSVLRVGRALDNDVILTDPSLSPYHFLISAAADGSHDLRPLADENGMRSGRRRIDEPVTLDDLPFEFDAGRTRFRVMDRSQPVPPTRLMNCRNGGACIFGHWGWALFLVTLFVLVSGFDNYLSTYQVLSWESFWSDQLIMTATALGLAVGLSLINRLVSHRWDFPSALSLVSLLLVAGFAVDSTVTLANYFFTSQLPGFVINMTWLALVLPVAVAWYLLRLHHAGTLAAGVIIVMLFTPGAYLQFKQFGAHYNLFGEFSNQAHYNNALYPWDLRIRPTVSIGDFLSDGPLTQSRDAIKN